MNAGRYSNIRLLHFDHNPQQQPEFVTNGSIATNKGKQGNSSWLKPAAALADKSCRGDCASTFESFSAACWYFGAALADRMLAEQRAAGGSATPVPLGLIESAFGGTCIESWLSVDAQLACSNITCTSNQSWQFTKDTVEACAAVPAAPNSAGANAELYNGMVRTHNHSSAQFSQQAPRRHHTHVHRA